MIETDLRTRLKALVETMFKCYSIPFTDETSRDVATDVWACQFAALLAESEPEPRFSDVTATRCLRHATIPPTILPPASQECGLCMREEGVLVGRSEQRPEIAWLIESRLTPSPTWWTGSDWTRDSLKAVRFCRKQDAEAALATLPDKHVCFTSEHQWGFGAESEPGPCCSVWRPEHEVDIGRPASDVRCADCGLTLHKHPKPEPVDWPQPQELVITADGPLEPEPPLSCSCKSRQARGALAPR